MRVVDVLVPVCVALAVAIVYGVVKLILGKIAPNKCEPKDVPMLAELARWFGHAPRRSLPSIRPG